MSNPVPEISCPRLACPHVCVTVLLGWTLDNSKTLSIAVRASPKESPGMEGPEGKGEGGGGVVKSQAGAVSWAHAASALRAAA